MRRALLVLSILAFGWLVWKLVYPSIADMVTGDRLDRLSRTEMSEEYGSVVDRIAQEQKRLGTDGKPDTLARPFLFSALVDSIFPYWHGTPWEYHGTTEVPRNGSIACGYFVTTSLRDAGFKCDRTKLAQQTAATIIATFCSPGRVTRIGHGDYGRFLSYFQDQSQGVWIVGLDNHVGFVVKRSDSVFAIHSCPFPQDGVQREPIESAQIFRQSKNFFIGALTSTDRTVQRWANNEPFPMKELE